MATVASKLPENHFPSNYIFINKESKQNPLILPDVRNTNEIILNSYF